MGHFNDALRDELVRVAGAFTHSWTYVRQLDLAPFEHWKTLPAFQPDFSQRARTQITCAH